MICHRSERDAGYDTSTVRYGQCSADVKRGVRNAVRGVEGLRIAVEIAFAFLELETSLSKPRDSDSGSTTGARR